MNGTEDRSFRLLMVLTIVLVGLTVLSPALKDSVLSGLGSFLERRYYYERVISKRDLSLHRAMHWRQKE